MQYFKPEGSFFVGDCMPFFHEGVFHLFYLLDQDHHQALSGLGGHQWAHVASTDLKNWTHYPLAIPITTGWEGSICTGSVFFHEGTYYGFYATRRPDRTQHLSLAVSRDAIHFQKQEPNPLALPPQGYSPYHYRDPVVFRDEQTGLFHMLVTASLEDYPVPGRGGCLAHLVSKDLQQWQNREPFLIPGLPGPPECPDYFAWNGWYYLLFSSQFVTHYRMSRNPFGPWLHPQVDTLAGPAARVLKTATFTGNRRIGAAWLGTRVEDKDHGPFQFGGNAVFREIVPEADGRLGTKFPVEMTPVTGPTLPLSFQPVTPGVTAEAAGARLAAREGLAVAQLPNMPHSLRLTARIRPEPASAEFGFRWRAAASLDSGYELSFSPYQEIVRLHDQALFAVEGLDRPFSLEVILLNDIIDVCIDNRRTIVNRCPELRGDRLLVYAQNGEILFEEIELSPIL